eukprot:CAMPEP_0178985860 /NCGR_PEP_ID=MMETSP0795-20121207/2386_1 /TAXON_ID=88552 /ORGANISM="Amoebophrya sp., Strain Ameob2" /LENGTH=1010 /DNA_ID=CAMNT_0020676863 /DNA_START=241 /DNA_END=3273 /DNA_ORIENTATION=-
MVRNYPSADMRDPYYPGTGTSSSGGVISGLQQNQQHGGSMSSTTTYPRDQRMNMKLKTRPPLYGRTADLVGSKLTEYFFEWLSLPTTKVFLENLQNDKSPQNNLSASYGSSKPILPDQHLLKATHPPGVTRSPTSPPGSPTKRFSPEKHPTVNYNEGFERVGPHGGSSLDPDYYHHFNEHFGGTGAAGGSTNPSGGAVGTGGPGSSSGRAGGVATGEVVQLQAGGGAGLFANQQFGGSTSSTSGGGSTPGAIGGTAAAGGTESFPQHHADPHFGGAAAGVGTAQAQHAGPGATGERESGYPFDPEQQQLGGGTMAVQSPTSPMVSIVQNSLSASTSFLQKTLADLAKEDVDVDVDGLMKDDDGGKTKTFLGTTTGGRKIRKIPRFFFPPKMKPSGKPLTTEQRAKLQQIARESSLMCVDQQEHIFNTEPGGGEKSSTYLLQHPQDLNSFLRDFLGLSKYLNNVVWGQLLRKIGREPNAAAAGGGAPGEMMMNGESISNASEASGGAAAAHQQQEPAASVPLSVFEEWVSERCEVEDPYLSFFHIVKQPEHDYLTKSDFRVLLETVLQDHPGLEFLKGTREFQEKYADTVIARIFFITNAKDDGRITLQELRAPAVYQAKLKLARDREREREKLLTDCLGGSSPRSSFDKERTLHPRPSTSPSETLRKAVGGSVAGAGDDISRDLATAPAAAHPLNLPPPVAGQSGVNTIFTNPNPSYHSIVDTWRELDEIEDMKTIRRFFSYEHFYVIYCTFWELDSDHDCLLDKDDLLKYDTHALSRRAAERIFSEIPRKFTSGHRGRMCYDDFIFFLLCDQDRLCDRSIGYWFKIMDLDATGILNFRDINFFFEEQSQRMQFLNYDPIASHDVACQMFDMLHHPHSREDGSYTLGDFMRNRRAASVFFQCCISLQKFLAWEHRDPFAMQSQGLANTFVPPGAPEPLSEWDRWCQTEYLRLAVDDHEGDYNEDEGAAPDASDGLQDHDLDQDAGGPEDGGGGPAGGPEAGDFPGGVDGQ